MLKINVLDKLNDNEYIICLIDERVKGAKYGIHIKYNKSKKTINTQKDDKAVIISLMMLNNDVDIFDLIEDAINGYREIDFKDIAEMFRNCINI